MFIKTTPSVKGDIYFYLTNSRRVGDTSRQDNLLSLGKAGDGKLNSLINAVNRYTGSLEIREMAKSMQVEKTYILGPLLILQKLFQALGINQALEEAQRGGKASFDLRKIVFALAAARFVSPGSKLKVFEELQGKFYPGIFKADLQLHQIYRALDALAEGKDRIEQFLYWHRQKLFKPRVDVVLYDLTTLRFESVRTDKGELRQFGYSKERRGDCVQVVLGLLVDKDGLPLGFEVYPGNTFEGRTVSDIERKLRKKFEVGRFVFVGDRGLFSRKNLEVLSQSRGGEFIVGMKLGSLGEEDKKECYDLSRFQKISEGLAVYDTEFDLRPAAAKKADIKKEPAKETKRKGRQRLIITWSAKRAERDKKAREEVLSKIEAKLKSGGRGSSIKKFITNEAYRKYIYLKPGGKPALNKKAAEEASKKDGFFGIVTNVRDMKAGDLARRYKELWRVEDAFGELKGTLKARPVFHWTDRRITGHLVMCFIAHLCGAYLTRRLRERGSQLKSSAVDKGLIKGRPLTVPEGMRSLLDVQAIPVEIKKSIIWVRTEIEGNAAEMFRAARAQIPKKLLDFCPFGEGFRRGGGERDKKKSWEDKAKSNWEDRAQRSLF